MPAINVAAVQLKVGLSDWARWTAQLAAAGLILLDALEALAELEGTDPRLLAAAVLESLHDAEASTLEKLGDLTVEMDAARSLGGRAASLRAAVQSERMAGFSSISAWGIEP